MNPMRAFWGVLVSALMLSGCAKSGICGNLVADPENSVKIDVSGRSPLLAVRNGGGSELRVEIASPAGEIRHQLLQRGASFECGLENGSVVTIASGSGYQAPFGFSIVRATRCDIRCPLGR